MAAVVRKPEAPVRVPMAMNGETGWPLVVRLRPAIELTEDQFFEFCQINSELRFERTAEGELLIMTPEGGETGARSGDITMQLGIWAKKDGTGVFFGSSTGFRLPDTSMRAPDAAWMLRSRWEQIRPEERRKFIPACPDFVLELRSPSDTLRDQQDKMERYLRNGARLGWLLDPEPRHVYVYRPGAPVERLENPENVSGDPLLPGFVLDLQDIW